MNRKLKKYLKVLTSLSAIESSIVRHLHLTYPLSDEWTVRVWYWIVFHRRLNLSSPTLFSEKLQWLKLHNRHTEYHSWVDKAAVKTYVADKIGAEYVVPAYGVWDSFDKIEWDKLPSEFVLKTTSGCGGSGVVVCKDKKSLDKTQAKKKLEHSFNKQDDKLLAEWPYRDVPKRIIAEQYLEDASGELRDYKFFCFNGKVRCFKIDFGRMVEHHANYYTPDGELLPFGESAYWPDFHTKVDMPINREKMIELAEKLSNEQPFLRVDFYEVNGKVYFGELTFYPASGLSHWTTKDADELLGSWINLKEINTHNG